MSEPPISVTASGACGWDVVVDDCAAYDSLSDEKQAAVVEMAIDFLWNWTQRVFGVCEAVVRPCRQDCRSSVGTMYQGLPLGVYPWGSVYTGGMLLGMGCGRCGDLCGCPAVSSLRLPGPVQEITEILVDGEVLDPTVYRVDNGRFLIRLDGEHWPLCQDMALDVDQPDTWQITYTRGIPVPVGGLTAASILACQFAKAIATPKDCALPERIQQITRQGVTVTVMNDFAEVDQGRTGLYMVDSWVSSVLRPVRPSRVYSPDIPRPKFRSGGSV